MAAQGPKLDGKGLHVLGLSALQLKGPAVLRPEDRFELEEIFLRLRLTFLLAPMLLLIAYGFGALKAALLVEAAVLLDCGLTWAALRLRRADALRWQLVLRVTDLLTAYVALQVVHRFVGAAYYDSIYLFIVVAATATHGRAGTFLLTTLSTLAVLLGRLQLIAAGVLTFQIRHVTDALFYALLFLTTGAITDFLMWKSAAVMAHHDREAEQALRESEERYRELFENARDAVYVHDLQGRFLTVNRAGEVLTGYSCEELTRLTIRDVVAPQYVERVRTMIGEKIAKAQGTTYEVAILTRDGRTVEVEVSSQLIERCGVPIAVQGIARDITERKTLEERLRFQAMHDTLTGLPNRALFYDRLMQTIAHANRTRQRFAVLIMDLDRFKEVNDTSGHQTGDMLLQHVAAVVRSGLRESDTVARLGGDEFAVLLPDTDEGGAARVCADLLRLVTAPFEIEGERFQVEASIGATLPSPLVTDVSGVLRRADAAMYRAKRAGAGFEVCADDVPTPVARRSAS